MLSYLMSSPSPLIDLHLVRQVLAVVPDKKPPVFREVTGRGRVVCREKVLGFRGPGIRILKAVV